MYNRAYSIVKQNVLALNALSAQANPTVPRITAIERLMAPSFLATDLAKQHQLPVERPTSHTVISRATVLAQNAPG